MSVVGLIPPLLFLLWSAVSGAVEPINRGLFWVKAEAAYARGYTGKGVKVAVMDTLAFSHHEKLKSSLLPGYDLCPGLVDPVHCREGDMEAHGTHVAGIIAADLLGKSKMHGVAYDAQVIPIRILGDWTYSNQALRQRDFLMSEAIRYGFEQGAAISNNSWGFVEYSDGGGEHGLPVDGFRRSDLEAENPREMAAYREAIQQYDQIFVFAAGNLNDGSPARANPDLMGMLPALFPEFQSHWVTVVNGQGARSNAEMLVASSSHYCGAAAEWCITAPGTDILSTVPPNDFERMTGTSMAAPHVSGGLAVLKSAFPNLSGDQLVRRLFMTANKTGIYQNKAQYGQGLMDLDKATQPIGPLKVPVARWQETSAFSLRPLLEKKKLLVLDSFDGAPFYLPGTVLIASERRLPDFKLIDEQSMPFEEWMDLKASLGHQPSQSGWGWRLTSAVGGGGLQGLYQWKGAGWALQWHAGQARESAQGTTLWQGPLMRWSLRPQWQAWMQWQQGWTWAPTATEGDPIQLAGPSLNTAMRWGLQWHQGAHRVQGAWLRPTQTVRGTVKLHWPVALSPSGELVYEDTRVLVQSRPLSFWTGSYAYQMTPALTWSALGALGASQRASSWAALKADFSF